MEGHERQRGLGRHARQVRHVTCRVLASGAAWGVPWWVPSSSFSRGGVMDRRYARHRTARNGTKVESSDPRELDGDLPERLPSGSLGRRE